LKLVHELNVLIGAEYGMAVDASAMTTALRANGAEIDEAVALARKVEVPFGPWQRIGEAGIRYEVTKLIG